MEEKFEKLVEMMKELQVLENDQMAQNDAKQKNNNNTKEIINARNDKPKIMREPFREGEQEYIELTQYIEANEAEIKKLDAENRSLNTENMEIRKGTRNTNKRNAISQLKQEIIDELTKKQRELVSTRKREQQEIEGLETKKSEIEAEKSKMQQEIENKEAEIKLEEKNDAENIAKLEKENEKISTKVELARQFVEEKATIDEEQEKLQKEIEDAKKGIEIEKRAVARSGYTGKLEVQEKWLIYKEEKFANNEKRLQTMKKTLRLRSLDGLQRFIQRNEKQFAKNLAQLQNQKPNARIEELNSEISEINTKSKRAEEEINRISSKTTEISENIPLHSGIRYSIIETISKILKNTKGINVDIKVDTEIDGIVEEIRQLQEEVRVVDASEYLENSERLSQSEIDEIVARTKNEMNEEELSNAKDAAKAKFEEYLSAKNIEKEQVPTLDWLMNETINIQTKVKVLDKFEDIEGIIKHIIKSNEEKIEAIKGKETITEEDKELIERSSENLDIIKAECDIIGIEYREIKQEQPEQEEVVEEKVETEQNEQTTAQNSGAEQPRDVSGRRQYPGTQPNEPVVRTQPVNEENLGNRYELGSIEISKNMEIMVYDNKDRKVVTKVISASQVAKNYNLSDIEKVSLINEITGTQVDERMKSGMNSIDFNFVYALKYCLDKKLMTTEQAKEKLGMYINALDNKENQEEMKAILEYKKYNKLFKGKSYSEFNRLAELAKRAGIAKVEEARGLLSRIFGKRATAIEEATFEPRDYEEPSFNEKMQVGDETKTKIEEVVAQHAENELKDEFEIEENEEQLL